MSQGYESDVKCKGIGNDDEKEKEVVLQRTKENKDEAMRGNRWTNNNDHPVIPLIMKSMDRLFWYVLIPT